ncbi:granulocyte colony-stimulating factor receptor [Scleropages formosus]|uniref:Colony stimulating factor 3 receptor n=1 Tax=Scleropages formosus TaxID=113540 RepID=A0A8C9R4C7_SCLFO|nr:granulocyte colony-stimulating factor receptor [Scleropages formosus]XP_018596886.1 granulocyte colony-stimulating factor receptor [Scleropages formosus]XP_018596887.1 granulocyte colony-stimulating factor receptor [Scleropages formosus]
MASVLARATGMVFVLLIVPEKSVWLSPCAQIWVPTSTVPLGSSLSASCFLLADCPLSQVPDLTVEWHLNQQVLTGNISANETGLLSSVLISSIQETRAHLTCCVCADTLCQIVNGVEIKAGYPPSTPQDLSCLTNLTKPYTLLCQWDPGVETHLQTAYTLHTKIWNPKTESKSYPVSNGVHKYAVPRADFSLLSKMQISVSATNALGQASSQELELVPMENASFDPPEVMEVQTEPNRYSCLKVRWRLSENQAWVKINLAVEMRWAPLNTQLWTSAVKHVDGLHTLEPLEVEQCGLLHGTEYHFQLRVRYLPGPWSDWSNSRSGYTLEKAPSGQLVTWLKVSVHPTQSQSVAQLFWKPSKQFQANSRNVSYYVFLRCHLDTRRRGAVCDTLREHCTFFLPKGVCKLYITARNKAGESSPTIVRIYQDTALEPVSELRVSPCGDNGLLVQWLSPSAAALTGYTVEWSSLCDTDHISFDVVARNESSFLITGAIEPYTPYRISVYSMYQNGVGLPQTVEGCSKQKAPSAAPLLQVEEVGYTHVKLTWDEIPPDQRNGIIQSYTVYYWNAENKVEGVSITPTERQVILKDLMPFSMYKALLQVNTGGGSLNGTIVTLKTDPTDIWSVMFIVVMVFTGLLLPFSLSAFICFTNGKRIKMRFWPMVPDPANSSIRNWKETNTLKDNHHYQDIQDPTPLNLSRLSLLEMPEKKPEMMGVQGNDSSKLTGPISSCSPPPSPGGNRPLSDSIPYVTVVFNSPYRSQTHVLPPAYLRSESTQPLLAEEPSSPASYHVEHPHTECGIVAEGNTGGSTLWGDFPLLSALKIEDVEALS